MSDLNEKQKAEIDEFALQRVRALNNDEFLCQEIDKKIHEMGETVKAYFNSRLAFHTLKEKK